MIDYLQLISHLSVGIVVINRDMEVLLWNRWMEEHSHITQDQILGKVIVDVFPILKQKGFPWKVQTVFKLGNFAFFSQKLHRFLFEFENTKFFRPGLSNMQQNVILAPLRGANDQVEHISISIFDVTDSVIYENELVESRKKIEDLSKTDELTQINNRRNLMARLNEELALHKRSGCELSVILIDVDHFKQVNDVRGHLCGDYVLRELANILKNGVREYDVLGRYGGEEFGVVLPGAGYPESFTVAERLRTAVERHEFQFDNDRFNVTISLGYAGLHAVPGATPTDIFRAADECLYKAKNTGRNRVIGLLSKDAYDASKTCEGPRKVPTCEQITGRAGPFPTG